MAKQGAIEMEGTVAEVLPNATFRVTVNGGHDVLTTLGLKIEISIDHLVSISLLNLRQGHDL